MAHLLEQKITRVRRQVRGLLLLYAVGSIVACVVAATLLLGLADYLIRFRDPGIRVMCSLALAAVGGWCVYRFGSRVFRQRLADVQIARRVEQYYPVLADRLASSIEFLKQSDVDAQAGSAALRRAVVVETASDAEQLDFSQVIDRRSSRRALVLGGALLLVALAIALVAPLHARTALARLARPLGDDAWPRMYHVAFRQAPTRLSSGQTFEVELLRDSAHHVPDDVKIHFRYETGAESQEESEPMRLLNGAMVARKENVNRPFSYRAEGGDDQSMEWIRLEVIEPPRVESLKLTLHPPAYTGLPAAPSENSIQAMRGTHVALAGTSTKKLRQATICQEGGVERPATLTADAFGFTLAADAPEPFVVDKAGPYWIRLEDVEGQIGGETERWEIRAIADLPPTLSLERPSGNVFVTPRGAVAVRIVAKDDLAIRDVSLHFSRSDNADVEDFTLPLYQGPASVAPSDPQAPQAVVGQAESRTVDHSWSLAELNLPSGAQITLWATAGDYLPQTGKSTVRRLTIISPAELEERLAQRQMLIFAELERVLKLQQDARGQTSSLEIQLKQVGQLAKQDVDHAQGAELNQRQVNRTLTSKSEGIPAQIDDFLADLASNQVDNPEMQRQMTAISDELARLGTEHLSTIERELTGVIKAAQAALAESAKQPGAPGKPDPQIADSLANAGNRQDQVVRSLEDMLRELRQWDNYRRFSRDIAQLQNAQQELARQTSQIAPKTLGRDAKDLDSQQQADLAKLAAGQNELSRRLEKTQQQMGEMARSLQATDPLSAAAISDGLHHADQQAISGQMRQSGDRIEKNQLSQAAAQQAKIGKDLDELMSILSNRREQELSRLVKQLREAEKQLAGLRSEQAGLRKKMRELAAKPDSAEQKQQLQRLAREQKQLEEQAARMARRLERLQADNAGRTADSAAGRMGQAGSAGEQGDAAAAEEQAGAAEKDLEEAQQQLAERRRQAEEDLAREQIAKLEDSLKSFQQRQQKLTAETGRLEKLRAAEGKFTRPQASTVHELAREQKLLQTETTLLADKLSLAEVINMALAGAAREMNRAAELLERQRTGSQTQTAQEAARLRFAQLLAALENKPKSKEGKEGAEQGGGEGGGKSGARQDGNQVLTQLKLLKILQEDLNSRYRTLTDADDASAAPQLTEIATEQGKLAELALKLAQPPDENPEDNPDDLPDVRKPGAVQDPNTVPVPDTPEDLSAPDLVPPPEPLEEPK